MVRWLTRRRTALTGIYLRLLHLLLMSLGRCLRGLLLILLLERAGFRCTRRARFAYACWTIG